MPTAQKGNKVQVHYTGKLDDGTVFDSSQGGDPLEFTVGQGQVIPGFENGVEGMEIGQSKTVNIPVEQAYGPHRPDGVFDVDRSELPPDMPLQIGMRLQSRHSSGRLIEVTVTEIDDEKVTMDANHPLAGKNLTFDIELVAIA